jgi:hypothetical protein
LAGSIPKSGVLDADDVWRVDDLIGIPENRAIAINNTVAVVKGHFEAGCEVVVLSWVFARDALYGPVVDAMNGISDNVVQIYLVASDEVIEARLGNRGDPERLDYSLSRLRLIEALPYPKIDTSNLEPSEVAGKVRAAIHG